MNKLQGLIQLIRPANCIMMGFATLIGALLGGRNIIYYDDFPFAGFLGFLTAFTFTGAAMSINDYYDREIDAINEPMRPIPSGKISPSEALALVFFLISIGLFSAFFTNLKCLILSLIALTTFITYSTKGKRTGFFGNLLVSSCVAIPFIYGSSILGTELKANAIIFASLAFLSNTGREITKGIVDVEGDRLKNVKTIAVVYGQHSAANLVFIFYVMAVVLSVIPLILGLVSFLYVPIIVITDIGFLSTSALLLRDYSKESARKSKKMALIWMLTGLVAFTFGVIF